MKDIVYCFPIKNLAKFAIVISLLFSFAMAISSPVDYRYQIKPREFKFNKTENGWVSPVHQSRFPFNELIYSWSIHLPEYQGFRLYLKVGFEDGTDSPWLYAGFWGKVDLQPDREKPEFDKGIVDLDHLKLNQKAVSFRFKVMSEGDKSLTLRPLLHVIITDNKPGDGLVKKFNKPLGKKKFYTDGIYDLPLRKQVDSKGTYMADRCQSAAVATAMEYFGKSINLEEITPFTTDPEYGYYGIWPRTIQAAIEFGFNAYIDRFRNWDDVRKTLAENKVILCSINMPKEDYYISPPYSRMGGHIVALNGITDDGRVIITDSALSKDNKGYLCQWLILDFEKIWMRNKGGVGMVICPPNGFKGKFVPNLEPFPKRDYKPFQEEKTNGD